MEHRFKDRYGDGGLALALTLARKHSGLTLAEIGRELALSPPSTSPSPSSDTNDASAKTAPSATSHPGR